MKIRWWKAMMASAVLLRAHGAVLYVDVNSTGAAPPYANWSTAAVEIQTAVDFANAGDVVVVTNGVYRTGGRPVAGYALTNRVAITKALTVQSVNGPSTTIIQGYQLPGLTNGDSAARCVYISSNATLVGLTLMSGATRTNGDRLHDQMGGGIWCETTNGILVSNCVLVGNTAFYGGGGSVYGCFSNCTFDSNYNGGAYAGILTGCLLTNNSFGSAAYQGVLNNCSIVGNRNYGPNGNNGSGAGVGSATLTNCLVANNTSSLYGGGLANCTAYNCTISNNVSWDDGGGAYSGTFYNCLFVNNSAGHSATVGYGGATYQSTLINCTLRGNWAGSLGGGSYYGNLNNCVLTGNKCAYGTGGGSYYGTLNNCTLTGNWAKQSGGGAYFSTLNNCIIYYNEAASFPNYYRSNLLTYCCTTPDPGAGTLSITNEPLLASDSHISSASPCRGKGSISFASGTDIDDEAWANPPSIGADEFHLGADTGPIIVSIQATWTNGIIGYSMPFFAAIKGQISGSYWTFGDGTTVSNRPYASHSWESAGTYPVVLTAFNETFPGGISSTTIVQIATSFDFYAALSTANPAPPYTSWATAARNIQDAVDVAAAYAGATVWVSNGVYSTGGRAIFENMSNRVAVSTPITVRSLNGPDVTIIQGYPSPVLNANDAAMRCVYLTNGASLIGFTIENGGSHDSTGDDLVYVESGGGLWAEDLSAWASNCIFRGNSALHGGGARGATLYSCILSNNNAQDPGIVGFGGGASYCSLSNCILTANWAGGGGAAEYSTLNRCIIVSNNCPWNYGGAGAAYGGTLNNCIISSNFSVAAPGAAYGATLNNCLVTDNSTLDIGGGAAWNGTLNNCTVVGNSAAAKGGGLYVATARNCVIYYNTASNSPNSYLSTVSYCCTTPTTNGIGNITNVPGFVDLAGRNLRLLSNSTCINSGNNAFAPSGLDLDANVRIRGNTVDIGAYEFQNPMSGLSYAWLQKYGLPIDGSLDFADTDGDGFSNWQEWIADTSPIDPLSFLKILTPTRTNSPPGVLVRWQGTSTNRTYFLQRATNLALASPFSVIKTNISPTNGLASFVDTNTSGAGPYFYRVGVQR